ncbi:hypothetical protein FGO68_gene16329 [Halteria grandinella]|uniref:Uncharacterized protein n=1 Tax=Halteria grandinella TaxID=5974 RepID=A0A8J8T5J2_HALGN|nr:hypothetical protein FGO68_gene16329 [Halteria grandinella]
MYSSRCYFSTSLYLEICCLINLRFMPHSKQRKSMCYLSSQLRCFKLILFVLKFLPFTPQQIFHLLLVNASTHALRQQPFF